VSFSRVLRPSATGTLALLLIGCGARSELETPNCSPLHVDLAVREACEIARPGDAPVDAEGFVSVQSCSTSECSTADKCGGPYEPHRVFVMNRLGAGHVIGWCDSTTLIDLMGEIDAADYLGQMDEPRVAAVGDYPCGPGPTGIPGVTYLGEALPSGYEDGAVLATDWDVLIACGWRSDFGDAFAPAVLTFVREQGRGLLAVSDYMCAGAPGPALAQMNAVTGQAGFVFEPEDLGWGNGDIDLNCVRDYRP
jgi:hypothetical protein